MFYSKLMEKIKPTGRLVEKAYLELKKYVIELTNFGLLKTNKELKPGSPDIANIEGSDYFEVNRAFAPAKKAPVYRSQMLAMLPEHIRKAFALKYKDLDEEEKLIEKERKVYVVANIIKILKHIHHNKAETGGVMTFDDLLAEFSKGRLR